MAKTEYPEHEKLALVKNESHLLGEMLDWMQGRGYMLARWEQTEFKEDRLIVVHKTVSQWLAEFYDIDLVKIEDEKRQMLDKIRELNRA